MKTSLACIAIAVFIITIMGTAQNKKRDVADYFLILPEDVSGIGFDGRAEVLKTKAPKEYEWGYEDIDRGNGYLRLYFSNGSSGHAMEVVLWTLTGKPDIIGVNVLACNKGVCRNKLYSNTNRLIYFYESRNNHLTDVTASVFPDIKESDFPDPIEEKNGISFECSLPKVGVNIICKNSKNSRVEFVWADGRFTKKGQVARRRVESGPLSGTGPGMVKVGNLIWQKCSAGENSPGCSGEASKMTWDSAEEYCRKLDLGGQKWRLPTTAELMESFSKGGNDLKPAIDRGGPDGSELPSIYWSSTPHDKGDPKFMKYVEYFNSNGQVNYHLKTFTFYARCVSGE